MPSIDPKILGKIKKCLALSASDNPAEAATALRQAHALMGRYGVSAHQITASDIGESSAKSNTMSRDKPAHWEARLAATVGKAFGCQLMISRTVADKKFGHMNEGRFIFVGLKHQAEIAAYTADVLMRKCKSARKKWVAEHFAGMSVGRTGAKAKITRLGDMFAEGWVEAIAKLVADFAAPPEVSAAIDRIISERVTPGSNEASTRITKGGASEADLAAARMGMKAAKDERLHRPMTGAQAPLGLEG